jgi:hypothetical protein
MTPVIDDVEPLRYPVGRMPRVSKPLDPADREAHLRILEDAPARFRALAKGLTDADLEQPYRPGGWTLRQVFHHVPDSHLHAYIRMKWAATEESPQVKTYDEGQWSALGDATAAPIEISLALLEALHRRWVAFLRSLSPAGWRRTFLHPEWGTVTIEESLTMYTWHSRHHAAHIEIVKRVKA